MDNKIGKFIAILRKEVGLTQQELGEKLYVTDKAVSKWERGLSLPDVTLLTKLAEILGVEVTEILQGTKLVHKKDINKLLEEEKKKLEKYNKKRMIKITIPLFLIILFLLILLFKNIYLGYDIKTVKFPVYSEVIDLKLGVPKMSFLAKQNIHNYSFKNFRSAQVIENEIKQYLRTLKYLNCNDSIYYYDETSNVSIVDFSVKDNLLYSTVSYGMTEGDYCHAKKWEEIEKILGLGSTHSKNGIYRKGEDKSGELGITLIHDITEDYQQIAKLYIIELGKWGESRPIIEESKGTYYITGNKFIYYREEITTGVLKDKIPKVSIFTIDDQKLILDENYLSSYIDEVVLEIDG